MLQLPEIMAPVGNFETLAAAMQANADSVYFGVEHLNMRAKSANNFKLEDLKEIRKITREHNAKAYLALNTVIYDHEIRLMNLILDRAKEAEIDAIIASDLAVITAARDKGLTVHASTQLNISNIEAVKFFSQFCDTMVLARELSLTQTKKIVEAIDRENITGPNGEKVKIEIFVHGALCMAISGKCYMSLHEFNSSANRGACMQTCRRPYIVTDKETGYELEIDNEYIMSPKDLATIEFVDKIMDAGVSIFKIEGRARPPEYVKTVTEVYKEATKSVIEGNYTPENIKQWKERLATVFNRGFWDGYYLGRRLGEWTNTHGSKATKKKIFAGKITNYFSKIGVAEVKLTSEGLSAGDNYLITGNKTGVVEGKIEEIRLDDKKVEKADKGSVISFKVPEKVRRGDKLYKIVEIK